MTIQANFPNVQPSLLLDFANAKQLPPSVTFTRATTAAYYDGSTTAMAEQNLMIQSQAFGGSPWATFGSECTLTSSTQTDPAGTSTAGLITYTGGGSGFFYQQITLAAGVTTFSIYARGGTKTKFGVQIYNNAIPTYYISSDFSLTGSWQRFTFTFTNTLTSVINIEIRSGNSSQEAGTMFIAFPQVEQRSTATAYTATTTQAITNHIPVLLTAGGGQPRFDHNPTTSESLGLLIEEARINLCTYSEDIASWPSNTRVTINSNSVVAPSGALTADTIVPTSGNATHYAQSALMTGTAGNYYTGSVYAKPAGWTRFALEVFIGGNDGAVWFDLSAGTIFASTAGYSGTITAVGNGWYKLTVTSPVAVSSTNGTLVLHPLPSSVTTATTVATGDGFNGVTVWGAQMEAAAFATSYIPTTSAAATRAADLATMTGVNFSSWFNNGQGTFVTQFMMPSPTGQLRRLWDIENTNTPVYNNLMAFNGYTGSNSTMYFEGSSSNSTQFAIDTGSYAANTSYRVAMAYQVNDFAASTSGGTVQTDTVGTLPLGLNALWLGSHRDGIWYNGYINKFAYYPVRVTNAQLQALSS